VGGYGWSTVGGESLAMWAEYFPHGKIVGLDVVAKRLKLDPRITVLQGAQDDAALLASVCAVHGPFDIVIDDGSHVPKHVCASFDALFPHLKDGGLYVIEDVQTTFWPMFGGSPVDGGATMALGATLLRWLNHAEISVALPGSEPPPIARIIKSVRAFHNLIVVEKGENDEPSNLGAAPDDPHVARARAIIEREIAAAPSPGAYAALAGTHFVARDFAGAVDAIMAGLARWPENTMLLSYAVDCAGSLDARLALLERLAAYEGMNARMVERARRALGSGGTVMAVMAEDLSR
jgi:hypothetical protein